MLDQITPVILTFDEEANIGRTLAALSWASDVLIVDSGSTDATAQIAARFPNTRMLTRAFDNFACQWNHALEHGGLATPWVLALDADYVLTAGLTEELRRARPAGATVAYRAHFRYCVDGRPLRGTLYPAAPILFRRGHARYVMDGHCQRIVLGPGEVVELEHPVLHDDRKPIGRWLASQRRYARDEARKLVSTKVGELSWPDRVRKVPFLAAPAVLAHCLVARGCLLDGRAGLTYAAQRALAETIISLQLLRTLRTGGD